MGMGRETFLRKHKRESNTYTDLRYKSGLNDHTALSDHISAAWLLISYSYYNDSQFENKSFKTFHYIYGNVVF